MMLSVLTRYLSAARGVIGTVSLAQQRLYIPFCMMCILLDQEVLD